MTDQEFHSFRHGNFDITVLSDGHIALSGEIFAPEATATERAQIVSRLSGADNTANAQSNIPLIVSAGEVILIDVGAGERFQASEGKLEDNLGKVGVKAEDITIIVITHAHPDHIWGLIRADGSLRFPNAKYFVGRSEWEFWQGEGASSLPPEVQPFVQGARRDLTAISDRVNLVHDGDEITAGIRIMETRGHTPGHLSVILEGDVPLIVTADAIHSEIVSFEHPGWSFGFDMDPTRARSTRKALFEKAVADNAKLLGFHWTYPGVGKARAAGDAYEFVSAVGEQS